MKYQSKTILLAIFLLIISSFSFSATIAPAKFSLKENNLTQLSSNQRKKQFIKMMEISIEDVENVILNNRIKVEALAKKSILNPEDKLFLNKLYTQYKLADKTPKNLAFKMIVPPKSLIIAQAVLESGWGTSRLSREGNNIFGMMSLNSNDPRMMLSDKRYYRVYENMAESVHEYVVTISRHNAYASLRKAINKGDGSLKLVKHLSEYSEIKAEYGKKLTKVITSNNLIDLDS
ncbi:MAG: glucosaminidase domain-containing protein [Fusobacteriaceae bacterium]